MSAEIARRIWFLEAASEDIVAAFEWYETKSPGLGTRFIEAVDASVEPLLEFPELCEIYCRNTRRCFVEHFPYEIFYRSEDDLIIVAACMHAARDPKDILRRIGG